jgi:hypothetical protein
MIQAIELCQRLVGNVRKHTMTQGSKQTFADQKNLIIAELMGRETHSISQEQLLKKFWMHFNIDQLTMIMQSFEAAGLILTESVGNKIIYQMPEVRFKELKRYMDGK